MKFKFKKSSLEIVFWLVLIVGAFFILIPSKKSKANEEIPKEVFVSVGKNISEVLNYAEENNLVVLKEYVYDKVVEKDVVISEKLEDDRLSLVISNGRVPLSVYEENSVNELGNIPVMMYHGIINTTTNKYTGGNVDKDGYNRTAGAFREDLEFYYSNNYRMIRLIDYINGSIDTELGKSPIVLTFDDGREDNLRVTGRDAEGNIIIDPNSAVGILEEFKKKYPDFNVTATFFVNAGLFNQKEYNEEILKWLVENGYDVGNHTTNHADFTTINTTKTQEVVGKMYEVLDGIIPSKYVKIVALPFGSPYKKSHTNFSYILKGNYNGKEYTTDSAIRVGWTHEFSPFSTDFDKTFIKRCRAYDNNGKDFDMKMVFDLLKTRKYISDGDKDTIVVPESSTKLAETGLEVIKY